MSYAKTTYTGPVKNRGKDAQGRAKVSREELADFRRKHGADKTLRDLLNADETGKTPASEKAPLARGPQGASIAPTRRNATQTMAERSASGAREAQAASGARAAAARESASEMKRESRGQGRQAESTSGMGSKITNRPAPGAKSIYRDLDPGKVAGAAATIASLYPASRMAGMAGRGLMSAMERRAAPEAKRITPMLATSRNAGTGKFRDTQGSLKESTEAAMKSRPGPEMGAGAKSGSGRVEPMLSTSRASDSGKFRKSDVSLKEATEAAKKGRIEPTFKKGGSVKGGGCETRSKKTRYV